MFLSYFYSGTLVHEEVAENARRFRYVLILY